MKILFDICQSIALLSKNNEVGINNENHFVCSKETLFLNGTVKRISRTLHKTILVLTVALII
jgi:hypothetical protein